MSVSFLIIYLITTSSKIGYASWYDRKSSGEKTASGEILDDNKLTCTSWDYPFNTYLKVTNINNNKSIIVKVNDRGPNKRLYKEGRIIDLSKRAFQSIADLRSGLIKVKIEQSITH